MSSNKLPSNVTRLSMPSNKSVGMSLFNPLLKTTKDAQETSEAVEPELTETSFLELVQSNAKIYRFMVLMGMIRVDANFVYCGIPKAFIVFWNYFLVFLLAVYVVPQLGESLAMMYKWHLSMAHCAINFVWVVFLFIQVYVIMYGVMYLRRTMGDKQMMDKQRYVAAFEHSLPICRLTLYFLFICSILSLVFFVVYDNSEFGGAQDDDLYITQMTVVVGQMLASLAGSCLLVGSLFVLIVEQRITLNTMKLLVNKARCRVISHEEYFRVREDIKAREGRLPIDMVVFAAILNTILGIILLLLYIGLTDFGGPIYWVFIVFLELSNFGREAIFLLVLLYEVSLVNDQAKRMINLLAEANWMADSQESEMRRLSVLHAAVCRPIGATIFYKKPTRNTILLQILSSVVVTLIALLKAYFVSKEGKY